MTKLIPQNNKIIVKEVKVEQTGFKSSSKLENKAIAEIVALPDIFSKEVLGFSADQEEPNYKVGDLIMYDEMKGIDVPKMKGYNEDDLIVIDVRHIIIKIEK